MTQRSKTFVAIWFFEKRTAELEDCTPRYEGVIIEYKHKVKVGYDLNYRALWNNCGNIREV